MQSLMERPLFKATNITLQNWQTMKEVKKDFSFVPVESNPTD